MAHIPRLLLKPIKTLQVQYPMIQIDRDQCDRANQNGIFAVDMERYLLWNTDQDIIFHPELKKEIKWREFYPGLSDSGACTNTHVIFVSIRGVIQPDHVSNIQSSAMSESHPAVATVMSVLMITSIVGNLLVCVVVKRNRDMRYRYLRWMFNLNYC